MSHLTEDELTALNASDLDRSAPFIIQGVSRSQFSVARHYGGCTFMGRQYSYVPPTDELIRDDVVKWLSKYRKAKKGQRDADKKDCRLSETLFES